MPQVISLKFAQEEMPRTYDPNGVEGLALQDFVVAEVEDSQDVGFIAGIEWVSTEQLKLRRGPMKRILRRATDPEKEAFFNRKTMERRALVLCKEKADEMRLPIKVTTSRMDPRDGRIVFRFTSDQRVDFRALVRELSAMLKARIELWQIGVRDEAKIVDGFGICGLRTCCSSWLPEFRPITIKMAKDQDINLPPNKLSGQCGRLLCCLSYEVDQYREMAKQLLPKGSTIEVEGRDCVIIDRNIIRQTYTVQFAGGETSVVPAAEDMRARVPDQLKKMSGMFARTASARGNKGQPLDADARKKARRGPRERVVDEGGEATDETRDDNATRDDDSPEDKAARRRRRGGRDRRVARPEGTAPPPSPQQSGEGAGPSPTDAPKPQRPVRRRGRGIVRGGSAPNAASPQRPPSDGDQPRREPKGDKPTGDSGRRGRRKGRRKSEE
jgi:cell fate regulator YaaT (PSP1 superfamily)